MGWGELREQFGGSNGRKAVVNAIKASFPDGGDIIAQEHEACDAYNALKANSASADDLRAARASWQQARQRRLKAENIVRERFGLKLLDAE